jgi:hypothetical protein
MIRELATELKTSGYSPIVANGGITVAIGGGTAVLGADEEGYTAYIQKDLPDGPVFESQEGLSLSAVLQLCNASGGVAIAS